jgi:hypothetical protein
MLLSSETMQSNGFDGKKVPGVGDKRVVFRVVGGKKSFLGGGREREREREKTTRKHAQERCRGG